MKKPVVKVEKDAFDSALRKLINSAPVPLSKIVHKKVRKRKSPQNSQQ